MSSVLSGENSVELANCVFQLASIAKSHVEHARQLMPQVPKEARPALVSAVSCTATRTALVHCIAVEWAACSPRLPYRPCV